MMRLLRSPYNANAYLPYISTYEVVQINLVVGVIMPYGV